MSNNQFINGNKAADSNFTFFEGQLVTPTIMNNLVDNAILKKGSISEQPEFGAAKTGTYSYITGKILNIQSVAHGLSDGFVIKATFTSDTGGAGSQFDGFYPVTTNGVDALKITVAGNETPSSGTVSFTEIPALNDEIAIHDVSDTSQVKPKKVTLDKLVSVSVDPIYTTAKIGAIQGKGGRDLVVSPENGPENTNCAYTFTGGQVVTVTKSNHAMTVNQVIVVSAATNTWTIPSGENPDYSKKLPSAATLEGRYIVDSVVSPDVFTYKLRDRQFFTANFLSGSPVTSTPVDFSYNAVGTITYQRSGSTLSEGNVVETKDLFVKGVANAKGGLVVNGDAKFDKLAIPSGRTADRPAGAKDGTVFFNRDDNVVEIYRNSDWETFDKISNKTYHRVTVASEVIVNDEATNVWQDYDVWTGPKNNSNENVAVGYRQVEIKLPRLIFLSTSAGGTKSAKIELIAKKLQKPGEDIIATEYVLAGAYDQTGSSWYGMDSNQNYIIQPWTEILTPSDIDLSDKYLIIRVTCKTSATIDKLKLLPSDSFLKITPMTRPGGVGIPTPWTSHQQTDSRSDYTGLGYGQFFGITPLRGHKESVNQDPGANIY